MSNQIILQTQVNLEGQFKSNVNLVSKILDLNDRSGVNKSGQTFKERLETIRESIID